MRKCIFCTNKADSKEHIWSDWILNLLPTAKNGKFNRKLSDGTYKTLHLSKPVQTAGIVCTSCNNGWMSENLEVPMQKIASDIIVQNNRKTFSASDCATISAWAFKSAILSSHISSKNTPFFSEEQRQAFAHDLSIPKGVSVWLAKRDAGVVTARFTSMLHRLDKACPVSPHLINPPRSSLYGFEIHDCIFQVGYLLLQVTATRWTERKVAYRLDPPPITQSDRFRLYSIPIWPISGPIDWPPVISVRNDFFDEFCTRFNTLDVPVWML